MNDFKPARGPARQSLSADQALGVKRYFFDVQDGDSLTRDETGINLSDLDGVAIEAYNLLRELVQDKLPEGQRTFTVRVRDEDGVRVFTGEMSVDGKLFRP